MGKFNLKKFVEDPTAEKLKGISRIDWLSIAKYYEIEISEAEKKEKIIIAVSDFLVEQGIITAEEGSVVVS